MKEAGKPDLYIQDLDSGSQDLSPAETISERFKPGDEVPLTADIRNQGDGDAGSSSASVELLIDGTWVRFDTNSTMALDAEEEDSNENLSFDLPSDLPSGTYLGAVRVDYRGQIDEEDEGNNIQGFIIVVEDGDEDPDSLSDTSLSMSTLSVGGAISGIIDPPDVNDDEFGDRDVVRVFLEEGKTYEFDLDAVAVGGVSGIDTPYYSVRAPSFSTRIDEGLSRLTIEAQETGYHYVVVGSEQPGELGGWRVEVDEVAPPLQVSISDATVEEGGFLSFRVNFSEELTANVTGNYVISYGTAEGSDLEPGTGTFIAPAGLDFGLILIDTNEDADFDNEQITVTLAGLSGIGGIEVLNNSATGTIIDDDEDLDTS